jgi:hypothetical protein
MVIYQTLNGEESKLTLETSLIIEQIVRAFGYDNAWLIGASADLRMSESRVRVKLVLNDP